MESKLICVLTSIFLIVVVLYYAHYRDIFNSLVEVEPKSHGLQFGVNVFAYIRGEFGVAESGRAATTALQAAGIPFVVMDLNTIHPSIHRHNDTRFEDLVSATVQTPYYFNLFILNADMSLFFYEKIGEGRFKGHYSIASWAWELDAFPSFWYKAFPCFDEIWGETKFVTDSIRAVSPIPVVTMKYPLTVMHIPTNEGKHQQKIEQDLTALLPREYFNLTSQDFIFWMNFDYYSFVERKNPHAVLHAFRNASPHFKEVNGADGDALGEAILVVKTNNVNGLPQFRNQSNELKALAKDLRVLFIEETLTALEMKSLYHHCDCYVSLHRSEGMGIGIPNAMYHRKPVIVTNYSGPVDYLTETTSYQVNYTLQYIEKDLGPYTKGNHWADANVEQASQHMVDIYNDRKRARTIAQNAHEHISEMYSPSKTGHAMHQRLREIWKHRAGINFYNSFKLRNYEQNT